MNDFDELIVRSLQGRALVEEVARLDEWRARAAEDERRYDALAEIWSLTAAAAPGFAESTLPDPALLIAQADSVAMLPDGIAPLSLERTEPQTVLTLTERLARRRWILALKVAALAAAFVPI